jgi:hypothetical protein
MPIRFQDFEVSWAGPNPFRPGFCFGSEDGRLLFTDEDGNDVSGRGPTKSSDSGEAINGVAGLQRWLAVTTRADVSVIAIPTKKGEKLPVAVFPGGAHGVIVTPSGYFISPLGRSGVLMLKPEMGAEQTVTIVGTATADGPYFYRAICLKDGMTEVLAYATRVAGVARMEFKPEEKEHLLTAVAFDGLDVVDLCVLAPGGDSLAAAAVGKDGTLVLFRDVLRPPPVAMKFDAIKGTAYCLLSIRGDIFLLTNKGLYVLAELAARFLEGQSLTEITTPVLALPMEAVDANLYQDRWLLVVMLDGVRRYDVGLLHAAAQERRSAVASQPSEVRSISPDWTYRQFPQKTSVEQFAAVG